MEILFYEVLAEINYVVNVVGSDIKAGTHGHEDSTGLLAQHYNVLMGYGPVPDQPEDAGPDDGADLLPKLGGLRPALVVIPVDVLFSVFRPVDCQISPE